MVESSNKPIGIVKAIKRSKTGKKDFWYQVGALWATKNSKVHKITLDAMPIDGVMYVVENEQDETRQEVPSEIAKE